MSYAFDDIEVDVKPKSAYIPPDEGMHKGALVDVIDMGLVPNRFKPGTSQRKVKLVYELEEKRPGSDFHYTLSETLTLSFFEQATLYKRLAGWKVPVPTDGTFKFSSIANRPALILVKHNIGKSDGKLYANIAEVMQDKSGDPYVPSGTYKRREGVGVAQDDDEEVPFDIPE